MPKKEYYIDIQKDIAKSGDFKCPNCKKTISPEDDTLDVFTVGTTHIVNGELEMMELNCNCGTIIILTGFTTNENKETNGAAQP